MALSKEETLDYIAELEEKLHEKNQQLLDRPERVVAEVHEVVIENSDMGGDLGALFGALAIVQGDMKAVGKNKDGHGYKFSNFQAIVEQSTPSLSSNGLSITQLVVTKTIGKVVFSGVKTILGHVGGGYVSSEAYVPTVKTKMNSLVQVFGVNTSYIKRYSWLAICGLPTTDDKTDTDGVIE